jgi:signal transduction histidine kinase
MVARRPGRLPPGKTVVLFVAVAAVSVVALVWMGARLLTQDRALEAQRLQERREAAADRVVAALEQVLLAEERRLANPRVTELAAGDDLLVVVAASAGIKVWPEKTILFYPVIPATREAPAQLYSLAERLEFVDGDHERAIAALRPLAASRDPAVRAGAELRLARNLRKAGRSDEALEVFGELGEGAGTVSGVPAGLVARSARCLLLEELGRVEQLRQEARELSAGLASARWPLDRDAYLHYSDQAQRWLKSESPAADGRQALAEGVCWLWENVRAEQGLQPGSVGRRSLRFHGTPVTVLWHASGDAVTALVAGPRYQQRQWFEPVFKASDFGSVRIAVRDRGSDLIYGVPPPTGLPTTLRSASATALPWDISVATADPDSAPSGFAQRRRFLIFGLVLVVLFVIGASYFAGRAVFRELAAATLQTDFVSAVSHEFRTPLTSMKQFTEMLVEDDDLPPEERRAYYRAQERATRRLSRLVESLLDFGRMEAGARPYRREGLDAAGLVRTVVEEFRQEGGCNSFSIEWVVPGGAVPIDGDREALAQALWNLLDNAVKYSGASRTVRVEVEDGGKLAAIRVRDQGLGVPPAERRRIFEKFARGSSAAASGIKGTGIGLAMVRHIVDAHGGKVSLESWPGGGSTFTIELPTSRDRGSGTRDQGLRARNRTTAEAPPPDSRSPIPGL